MEKAPITLVINKKGAQGQRPEEINQFQAQPQCTDTCRSGPPQPMRTDTCRTGPPQRAEARRSEPHSKCLVVEDILGVTAQLQEAGYACERITHEELTSRKCDDIMRNAKQAEYLMLWNMTPSSWHTRSRKK